MSSRCGASSSSRCSGVSFGRDGSPPLCSWLISGLLTVRHTFGGRNCPTAAPGADHRADACVPGPRRARTAASCPTGSGRSRRRSTPRKSQTRFSAWSGSSTSVLVAQQQHLLAREVVEEVLRPGGRTSRGPGSARTAPTRRRPAACSRRTASTMSARGSRPSIHRCIQLRVGAVHRVAQHRDQLRVGVVGRDPAAGVPVVEVERRALPAQRALRRVVEQVEVALALPDPLLVAVGVARPLVRRRRGVAAHVVLRLLDRLRNRCGCRASAACRALVPAFGAPIRKKSGGRLMV